MESAQAPHCTTVPGQHLGYSLQVTECLRQLLLAPQGTFVSVEVFEDVGVSSGSEQTAIQAKSALASNPISNHSPELWKTLSNWVNAIRTATLPPQSSNFRIHVFSPKTGGIAQSFAAANSPALAEAALESARAVLWGDPPTYLKRSEVAQSLQPYVENVLKDENEPHVLALIERFEMTFGSGCSRDDLKQAIKAKWAPEHALDEVLDKAHGWVKSRIDAAHEELQPAVISTDDFNHEISAFIAKLRFTDLLHDFAKQIAPSTSEVVAEKLRTYVAQLQLIEEDEEEILHAINCVLRGVANRTIWGKRGLVHRDSFNELETQLRTFWKNTKKLQDLDHKDEQPVHRGQRLYLECIRHRTRLQGKMTPDDFVPASFHELADVLDVGWHPEFKKLSNKA